MTHILCIGLAGQDLIFSVDDLPKRPQKIRAYDMVTAGGGLAATAAVAAARLGGRVSLLSRLGDDWVSQMVLQELRDYGVDCTPSRTFVGLRSSLSAALVTAEGERLIVNYSDARLPQDASWIPPLPADVRAVHGDVRWESGSKKMLLEARTVSVPGVLDVDRAPADNELIAAASHAAFSSQAVEEMLYGAPPEDAVKILAQRFETWIAVTAGADGTWFGRDGQVHHQPAFPIVPVDTLGAGDVFHGALTLALGEGMPEAQAVRFASAAAALKCERFGGRRGAPDRAETEALLKAIT